MGNRMASGAALFLGVTAGTCAALGSMLYFDKDLRQRVKRQWNDVLDVSEQTISFTKDVTGQFMGKASDMMDDVINLDDQWAKVYDTREES